MDAKTGSEIIESWPEESREAAQLVIDTYGEPHEVTQSFLVWHKTGPWKRIVASKEFYEHTFPAPHYDSVETVLDYRVPTESSHRSPDSMAASSSSARSAKCPLAAMTSRRTVSRST